MTDIEKKYGKGAELLWKDRKHYFGLPLSFTRYILVKKDATWMKLFLNVGFFTSTVDELNVYRVCDIALHQSIIDKIFKVGTITLYSSDESNPEFVLKNIKNPYQVREMFSNLSEEQRKAHNIRLAEFHQHN